METEKIFPLYIASPGYDMLSVEEIKAKIIFTKGSIERARIRVGNINIANRLERLDILHYWLLIKTRGEEIMTHLDTEEFRMLRRVYEAINYDLTKHAWNTELSIAQMSIYKRSKLLRSLENKGLIELAHGVDIIYPTKKGLELMEDLKDVETC